MFKLNEADFITPHEQLLYNIFELLSEKTPKIQNPKEPKKKEIRCPVCGKVYENQGQMMACARRHKREAQK